MSHEKTSYGVAYVFLPSLYPFSFPFPLPNRSKLFRRLVSRTYLAAPLVHVFFFTLLYAAP